MKLLFTALFLLPFLLSAGTVMFDDPMNDPSNWRFYEQKPGITGTTREGNGTIHLKTERGKKLYFYRKSAGFILPGETLKITFRAKGKGCVSFFYIIKNKGKKEQRIENEIFAVKSKEWKEYKEEISFDMPDIRSALIRLTVWGPADIEIDHFKVERIKK